MIEIIVPKLRLRGLINLRKKISKVAAITLGFVYDTTRISDKQA